jgi:hypothetical protein
MAGNSPVPYREVERAFTRGGAVLLRTASSHFIWSYRGVPICIVVHKNMVKMPYIKKARKTWHLTSDDGVKDDAFWNGNWE